MLAVHDLKSVQGIKTQYDKTIITTTITPNETTSSQTFSTLRPQQ